MRLTRQQQIQGAQSPDLAAVVWPLPVKEMRREFFGLTCNHSFTHETTRATDI